MDSLSVRDHATGALLGDEALNFGRCFTGKETIRRLIIRNDADHAVEIECESSSADVSFGLEGAALPVEVAPRVSEEDDDSAEEDVAPTPTKGRRARPHRSTPLRGEDDYEALDEYEEEEEEVSTLRRAKTPTLPKRSKHPSDRKSNLPPRSSRVLRVVLNPNDIPAEPISCEDEIESFADDGRTRSVTLAQLIAEYDAAPALENDVSHHTPTSEHTHLTGAINFTLSLRCRGKKVVVSCVAELCSSWISVSHPTELKFGDCNVGETKSQRIVVANEDTTQTTAKLSITSKIVSVVDVSSNERINEIHLRPHEKRTLRVDLAPRRINAKYERILTIFNTNNPKRNRFDIKIKASNSDDSYSLYHSLFYVVSHSAQHADGGTSGVSFQDASFRSVRTFKIKNISNKTLALDVSSTHAEVASLRCTTDARALETLAQRFVAPETYYRGMRPELERALVAERASRSAALDEALTTYLAEPAGRVVVESGKSIALCVLYHGPSLIRKPTSVEIALADLDADDIRKLLETYEFATRSSAADEVLRDRLSRGDAPARALAVRVDSTSCCDPPLRLAQMHFDLGLIEKEPTRRVFAISIENRSATRARAFVAAATTPNLRVVKSDMGLVFPDSTKKLVVEFAPTFGIGVYRETLSIKDVDDGATFIVECKATLRLPERFEIDSSDAMLDFGPTLISSSCERNVTFVVRNASDADRWLVVRGSTQRASLTRWPSSLKPNFRFTTTSVDDGENQLELEALEQKLKIAVRKKKLEKAEELRERLGASSRVDKPAESHTHSGSLSLLLRAHRKVLIEASLHLLQTKEKKFQDSSFSAYNALSVFEGSRSSIVVKEIPFKVKVFADAEEYHLERLLRGVEDTESFVVAPSSPPPRPFAVIKAAAPSTPDEKDTSPTTRLRRLMNAQLSPAKPTFVRREALPELKLGGNENETFIPVVVFPERVDFGVCDGGSVRNFTFKVAVAGMESAPPMRLSVRSEDEEVSLVVSPLVYDSSESYFIADVSGTLSLDARGGRRVFTTVVCVSHGDNSSIVKSFELAVNVLFVQFVELDPRRTGKPSPVDFGRTLIKPALDVPFGSTFKPKTPLGVRRLTIKSVFAQDLLVSAGASPTIASVYGDEALTQDVDRVLLKSGETLQIFVCLTPTLFRDTWEGKVRVTSENEHFLVLSGLACGDEQETFFNTKVSLVGSFGMSIMRISPTKIVQMGVVSINEVARGSVRIHNPSDTFPLRVRLSLLDDDEESKIILIDENLIVEVPPSSEKIAKFQLVSETPGLVSRKLCVTNLFGGDASYPSRVATRKLSLLVRDPKKLKISSFDFDVAGPIFLRSSGASTSATKLKYTIEPCTDAFDSFFCERAPRVVAIASRSSISTWLTPHFVHSHIPFKFVWEDAPEEESVLLPPFPAVRRGRVSWSDAASEMEATPALLSSERVAFSCLLCFKDNKNICVDGLQLVGTTVLSRIACKVDVVELGTCGAIDGWAPKTTSLKLKNASSTEPLTLTVSPADDASAAALVVASRGGVLDVAKKNNIIRLPRGGIGSLTVTFQPSPSAPIAPHGYALELINSRNSKDVERVIFNATVISALVSARSEDGDTPTDDGSGHRARMDVRVSDAVSVPAPRPGGSSAPNVWFSLHNITDSALKLDIEVVASYPGVIDARALHRSSGVSLSDSSPLSELSPNERLDVRLVLSAAAGARWRNLELLADAPLATCFVKVAAPAATSILEVYIKGNVTRGRSVVVHPTKTFECAVVGANWVFDSTVCVPLRVINNTDVECTVSSMPCDRRGCFFDSSRGDSGGTFSTLTTLLSPNKFVIPPLGELIVDGTIVLSNSCGAECYENAISNDSLLFELIEEEDANHTQVSVDLNLLNVEEETLRAEIAELEAALERKKLRLSDVVNH